MKALYRAGNYPEAYKAAATAGNAKGWVFLYREERRTEQGVDRFLRLTEGTDDGRLLGWRCNLFAKMNPVPPQGIEDAKTLSAQPDYRFRGSGFLTFAADARNRGADDEELGFLFDSMLTSTVLNEYSVATLRRIAALYDRKQAPRAALAFRALAWYVLKDRPAAYWYKGMAEEIAGHLRTLGRAELAGEWLEWSEAPLKSGVFPLYGVYKFPEKWETQVKASLQDFDRSTASRMWRYADFFHQLGHIDEAMAIADQTLPMKHASSRRKAMESHVAEWKKWSEVFPEHLVPLSNDTD